MDAGLVKLDPNQIHIKPKSNQTQNLIEVGLAEIGYASMLVATRVGENQSTRLRVRTKTAVKMKSSGSAG